MELKPSILAIFPPLVFLLLLNSFFMNGAMAQNTPFPVRVGVVLDMDNYIGKMGLICIKMALSDFYTNHAYYQTRLVLYDRDSKRDVVGAAAAATDDQILAELYKLMTMQTRVFIVHMLKGLGSRLFTKAKLLGMMSEDYAWIITYIPKTEELDNFTIQYKKEFLQNYPTAQNLDLSIFGIWAYDSAVALEGFGVSGVGTELIQALKSTTFRGLAGEFKLVDRQLQSPSFQIVNVIGPGARVVGYWMEENGIVRELNSAKSTTNTFGSIIWPGDKGYPPKGWVIPTNGKKLRIGVPVKDGFSEFMHVTWNSNDSYGVQYEYVPFATPDHKSAGNYSDLVYAVNQGVSIFLLDRNLMLQLEM